MEGVCSPSPPLPADSVRWYACTRVGRWRVSGVATPCKPWEYDSFVQVSRAITQGRAAPEQHQAVMSVLLGLIPSFVLSLFRKLVPPTPWVCEVRPSRPPPSPSPRVSSTVLHWREGIDMTA
jgi:hypothetical protein